MSGQPKPVEEISDELLYQYEAIRRSGVTNMLDYHFVHDFADSVGFKELSRKAATPQTYGKLIMTISAKLDVLDETKYQAWYGNQQKMHQVARALMDENRD